jgi:hypothetical protein
MKVGASGEEGKYQECKEITWTIKKRKTRRMTEVEYNEHENRNKVKKVRSNRIRREDRKDCVR